MALTREQILELVDTDEPDYRAAAAAVGVEGLPVLALMVVEADAHVAGRATGIVWAMAADPLIAVLTVPVIAAAALHADSGVRATASLGAARVAADAKDVIKTLLRDPDPSVRAFAYRGLSTPLDPDIALLVQQAAAADPVPGVRDRAVALAARNPDPSLGQELLAEAIEYAHARLTEFRAAALGDVAAFAATAGVAGFVDAGGVVAAALAAARAALDAVAPLLAARHYAGAATQLGVALARIQAASTAVGGTPFANLLLARIGWNNARPSGLTKQLGVPALPPALSFSDGALVYRLTAPGRSVIPPPLTFGFDRADLTARLALDGAGPALSVTLALTGLEIGVGGGPIASLLGDVGGSAHADVAFSVDTDRGVSIAGGAGVRVVLPARPKLGPLDVREIAIELPPTPPGTIDIASTITASIGGVVTAVVDGAGLHVRVDPAAAGAGDSPLSVTLKAPSGIGVTLDTGLVRGGGFLSVRGGGYGGALQLRLGPVDVKAVGLLTLEPRFALVVVMSIEFLPPIDLTFGFTLNAVGGLIGIEHRMDTDALRAALPTGGLDHIMFPPDPVAAAPAILTTLERVFPVDPGSIVIGPMIEIGWGRPVSFLTAQAGVLLSLPDPAIVIIGRVRIALPAPQLPIVDLRAMVYGEITPDHLLILVSLNGSRIAFFTVGGDIGFLVRWGGSPEFAVSAGGFHPRYTPPRELAGMKRLSIDLSPPAILTLRSESYFALTSNSVQLGSRVELGADLGVADISGHFGFDALIIFSPRFAFVIELGIGLTVRVLGVTLLGVHIELHLEGPAPWRAHGRAEVEIFWVEISIDVGPFTWGDADNPPPLPADPRALVHGALHRNPGAWQALTPTDADRVVRLIPAPPSEVDVTVHPMGLFDVRQHAVPLETVITHVGAHPVPDGQRRVHFGVPLVNETPAGALSEVTDLFSAGVFLQLTDDQKLSRPGFEPMPAGVRMRPPGEMVDFAAARETELRYETFVCDDDALRGLKGGALKDVLLASAATLAAAAGAAGRCELRARTRYAVDADPLTLADPGEVQVVHRRTVAATSAAIRTFTHAAEAHLDDTEQLARLGVA